MSPCTSLYVIRSSEKSRQPRRPSTPAECRASNTTTSTSGTPRSRICVVSTVPLQPSRSSPCPTRMQLRLNDHFETICQTLPSLDLTTLPAYLLSPSSILNLKDPSQPMISQLKFIKNLQLNFQSKVVLSPMPPSRSVDALVNGKLHMSPPLPRSPPHNPRELKRIAITPYPAYSMKILSMSEHAIILNRRLTLNNMVI